MSAERVVGSLAGTAVALILSSLVIAAFTLSGPSRALRPAVSVALAEARAAPLARDLVRDIAPAAAVEPEPAVADALVEPVPAPTPDPTAEPTPVLTPAPTSRPTSASTFAAPAVVVTTSTAAAEQRMLALMNAARVASALVPLTLDATVTAAARAHSAIESRYGYVYHDGPDGTAASRDVPACGTGWYGENTGKVWGGNVDRLHVEFMSEPWAPIDHRTNIMDPSFRRVGIGAIQGNDALYMTMVFCR